MMKNSSIYQLALILLPVSLSSCVLFEDHPLESGRKPVVIYAILDRSGSMIKNPTGVNWLERGLGLLEQRMLRLSGGDRMTIVPLTDRSQISAVTAVHYPNPALDRDRDGLPVRRYEVDYEYEFRLRRMQEQGLQDLRRLALEKPSGRTDIYGSLLTSSDYFLHYAPDRYMRELILITDGLDNVSVSPRSRPKLSQVRVYLLGVYDAALRARWSNFLEGCGAETIAPPANVPFSF